MNGKLIAAFAAVYLIWGTTYLGVALAVESIPPFLLMAVRSLIAGALLLGIALLSKEQLPTVRDWAVAVVTGLFLFVAGHGLLAYGQTVVPSGLAAILLTTIPFWILLIKFVVPSRGRPHLLALPALIPGAVGVALIAWQRGVGDGAAEALMLVLILVSAAAWALGSVISQRLGKSIPAITLAGMQLLSGGAALALISVWAGDLDAFSIVRVSASSWIALGYLIVAGSVITFTSYVWLLDHAPAPLVATYTFVNPFIAVALGWTLMGEQATPLMLISFALVIGSVLALWCVDHPGGTSDNRTPSRSSRLPRMR